MESKFALGTTSVITILFSLVIGFGVSGYVGIPLAQISPLAIFVVLGKTTRHSDVQLFIHTGIGVDGMIIMVDHYDYLEDKANKPLSESLPEALGKAAPAITLTSITDFVAFFAGWCTIMHASKLTSIYRRVPGQHSCRQRFLPNSRSFHLCPLHPSGYVLCFVHGA